MAAFTAILGTKLGNGRAGPTLRLAFSDVAAAFGTFTDLPGTPAFLTVPASGLRLADLSVSAVGGTVVALQFTKGVERKAAILSMGPLLNTLAGKNGQDRLGELFNMPLEPGAQYGIVQL